MMNHRFSNNFWIRKHGPSSSSDFSSMISRVLRDAAFSPDGMSQIEQSKSAQPTDRVTEYNDDHSESQIIDGAGTVFVPRGYEPNYPYPLIICLNDVDAENSSAPFHDLMTGLSDRNYLGLSPEPGLTASIRKLAMSKSSWNSEETNTVLNRLSSAIRCLRRNHHVHSERIILAGNGLGANASLGLFLARPEWFGGAVACGGQFSKDVVSLKDIDELRGKRVFLGMQQPTASSSQSTDETNAIGRLLYAAGVSVTSRICDQNDSINPSILAAVNEWVMDGICSLV
jgi:phospholipase/carboxylesterase